MANVVSNDMYNQLVQLYGGDTAKANKYKSKIETSYSTDDYNKLVTGLNKLYGSGSSNTKSNTSNNVVETYNGKVSDSGLNSISQSALDRNKNNAQVGTGHVAGMPEQPKLTAPSTPSTTPATSTDKLAKAWGGLDYETQQKKLNAISGLREALDKKGITSKTQPTTTTTTTPKKTTQVQTPKQQEWDYQDNSQARMNEILGHLNGYRVTNPELFEDPSAFYTFFIDGKGRSQDQIDYLWDYFNNVKKYGKYDNMTPEAIGNGLTNGSIPEDYLNNLKSTDPAKYQEVIAARQNAQDTIKYEDYLNSTAALAGMEGYESEPSSIRYGKWNEIWMDEDNNGIDDRREHYATKEEQGYQKQIADLNAANLDIDNTVKHTYDDYVKAYPGATKATLMAMAQDTNADLLREKENNLVELTRLQGYVKYMQEERFEMNEAGADSIKQLQDNLKMYYQYSPEGMAELAQAKYGATNITLDQADSGNETQKQMALQNVLDGYYDKYGDIIQRSEQQVINDVIAYAKKNGVGLAEALQENFVKPLQSKPEFATLSTGRSISSTPTDKRAKMSDDRLYNTVTGEIIDISTGGTTSGGSYATPGTKVTNSSGKSYTVISNETLINGLDSFLDGYEIGDTGGECGAFVNAGLKKIGAITENLYDNSLSSKLNSKNEEADATAQTGWVAIRNPEKLSGNGAKYGHVGWVIKDNGDGTVKVVDSNGTKNEKGEYDKTVGVHDVSKSSLYGYFNPTKGTGTGTSGGAAENDDLYNAKMLAWIPTQLRNTDVEKQWYIDIAKGLRERGLSSFEAAMAVMGFDITNNSDAAERTKQAILDVTMAQGDEIAFNSSVLSSMAQSINSGDYEGALRTLENQMSNLMASKGSTGLDRDNVSTAVKAIDGLNEINNYKSWLKGKVSSVKKAIEGEGKTTANFYTWVSNLKSTMRSLGYSEDDIDNMIPKITYGKDQFEEKVSSLEDAILGKYNQIRKNRGMPSISRDELLGNMPLYFIYAPFKPSKHNVDLKYGRAISAENEAFNSI